jgi:hypothetical protein
MITGKWVCLHKNGCISGRFPNARDELQRFGTECGVPGAGRPGVCYKLQVSGGGQLLFIGKNFYLLLINSKCD